MAEENRRGVGGIGARFVVGLVVGLTLGTLYLFGPMAPYASRLVLYFERTPILIVLPAVVVAPLQAMREAERATAARPFTVHGHSTAAGEG